MTCETEFHSIKSNDRRCVNYRRASERLAAPNATVLCSVGGPRRLAWICVCGSVRFQPEQVCAVTDSVSEQQRSVRSITKINYTLLHYIDPSTNPDTNPKCNPNLTNATSCILFSHLYWNIYGNS